MADQRISELSESTTPVSTDLIPMVFDPSGENHTRKITFDNLWKNTYLPHGCFSDSTTQTIANTSTAYPVAFNTDEVKHGFTHSTTVNNSRITVTDAGYHLITFSAIGKSAAPNKTLDIWLSVDGTNVPRSNTVSRFVGSANERIITVTFIYEFTAGQYFELYWSSNDTGTTLLATGVQSNPTRPASPSIILTVNKVSS